MRIKKTTSALAILAALMLTACGTNTARTSGTEEQTADVKTIEASEETGISANDGMASAGESAADSSVLTAEPIVEVPGEEPVEFSEDDINFIRGCFEIESDHFIQTPPQTFDFSDGSADLKDLNTVLNIAGSWKRSLFKDVPADDVEHIESELFGPMDLYYNTPQTVEKTIKEKLCPDFDISKYQITDDTPYWNSEMQGFSISNIIQADGYVMPTYGIIREGQEGNFYGVTVLVYDHNMDAVDRSGMDKGFFEYKRQKYLFRKLPNGNIAPLSMTYVEPEADEKTAFKTALVINDLYDAIKAEMGDSGEYYAIFLHDMDKDGNLDMVAIRSGNGQFSPIIEIYNDMNKSAISDYWGEVYPTKNGDWVIMEFSSGGTVQSTEYFFQDGDDYCTIDNLLLLDSDSYCTINGEKTTETEFEKSLDSKGILRAPFKYDHNVSEYLINNNDIDGFCKFIIYCMNNLI